VSGARAEAVGHGQHRLVSAVILALAVAAARVALVEVQRDQQEDDATFEFAPADAAFTGLVDELRWFVYQFGSPQQLPIECEAPKALRFSFDARGEAVERHAVAFTVREVGK
jgi:hypothetical protein